MNDEKLKKAIEMKREIKNIQVLCNDIDRFFECLDQEDAAMDKYRFTNIIHGAKDYLFTSDMTEYVAFIKDAMEEKLDYLLMEYKEL